MRALLLAALVLAGCESDVRFRQSNANLVYLDDVDAGVRCYDWTYGRGSISCVRVRP